MVFVVQDSKYTLFVNNFIKLIYQPYKNSHLSNVTIECVTQQKPK